jgi:hypothetical protein
MGGGGHFVLPNRCVYTLWHDSCVYTSRAGKK